MCSTALGIVLQGLSAGLHGLQELGQLRGQELLAVAAAALGLDAALADLLQDVGLAEEIEVRVKVAVLGIARVLQAHALGVGQHGHDLGPDLVHGVLQVDGVAVAFGHLAAVQARQLGRGSQLGLGLGEELAVEEIEAPGDLPGQFQVRQLVLAHGHPFGLVHDDVGAHEHRVAQEAVGVQILLHQLLLHFLVGRVALQPAERGHHGQEQVQLCMLLDLGLLEEDRALGIQARGQPVHDQLGHEVLYAPGLGVFGGQRVPVGHEEEAVVILLVLDPVEEHAEIVAEVERPGGPHAGDDAVVALGHVRISLRDEADEPVQDGQDGVQHGA